MQFTLGIYGASLKYSDLLSAYQVSRRPVVRSAMFYFYVRYLEASFHHHTFLSVLTPAVRTGRGGGKLCPPLMSFVNIFRSIRSIPVIFFSTCLKINGAPFGAKMEDSSILWGLFLSPKVSASVFRRADAMTGVSWRPPPAPAGWASRSLEGALGGGGAAERLGVRRPSGWGGGGALSRSRIAGSGDRAGHSSGGYRPGGRRRRANEDDRSCQDGVYGSCCSPLGLNY